jgi:hypothetical protein
MVLLWGVAADIPPVIAMSEAGENFVPNCAGRRGHCIEWTIRPDEINQAAWRQDMRGKPTDIQGHTVHRDAADDRKLGFSVPGRAAVAGTAEESIRVADRDRGDAPRRWRVVGEAVTDPPSPP